ncbi:MAG: pseudouridine synthase [Lactovum sp.]
MRLDKFLSNCKIGSRSEVKVFLKKSCVTVAGEVIKDGHFQVEKNTKEVKFNDLTLSYQEFYYYMLHKPQGYISATQDKKERTVLDLLDKEDFQDDIFPVGRLDKNTEGLLILTNDGILGHNLTQPKKHVEKEYFAYVDGRVTEDMIEKFSEGLILKNGETCRPAELFLEKIKENSGTQLGVASEIRLIIHEGKFHQVKRMFEALEMYVLYLKRLRMGELLLDETLEIGKYRPLTEKEIQILKS